MACSSVLQFSSAPLFTLKSTSSVFSKNYTPSQFTLLLNKHHETCLWSQLFFSAILSLACCVHQYQRDNSIYQCAIMLDVVGLTVISTLITTSSFYRPLKRAALFTTLAIMTSVAAIFTEFAPAIGVRRFERILQACKDVAKDQNLPWNNGAVGPYNYSEVSHRVFSYITLMLVLAGIWYFLWQRRERWTTDESVSQPTFILRYPGSSPRHGFRMGRKYRRRHLGRGSNRGAIHMGSFY